MQKDSLGIQPSNLREEKEALTGAAPQQGSLSSPSCQHDAIRTIAQLELLAAASSGAPRLPVVPPQPKRAAKRPRSHFLTAFLRFKGRTAENWPLMDKLGSWECFPTFFFPRLWNCSEGSLGLKHRRLKSRQPAKACVCSQTVNTRKLQTGSAAALL